MNSILLSENSKLDSLPEYQVNNDLGHQGTSRQNGPRRHRSHSNYFVQEPAVRIVMEETTLACMPTISSLDMSISRLTLASSTRYSFKALIVGACFNFKESNIIIAGLN